MFLTQLCLRNPIAVTLFYAFVGIVGVLGVARMNRSILPPIAFPIVSIVAPYPGAGPAEIERLVIEPIEDHLDGLPGVDRVSASAQDGLASIAVRFRFGTDLNAARANVRQAIDATQPDFPPDLIPPVVSTQDTARPPVLDEAISSAVVSPADLSTLVDRTILPALRATAGVGGVRVSGEVTRQLAVEPHAGALDALGATSLELFRTIEASNDVLPGGRFTTPAQEGTIGIRSVASSAEALGNFPFQIGSTATSVRVADVATVSDGYADASVISRVDGEPALVLYVSDTSDAGSSATIRAVRATFARLAGASPLVRFEQLRTDEPATNAAVDGVLQTLAEGVLLTTLVMLVFLRKWKDAAIAAIAMPTSLCAAFAAMWALGLTVNVLSLMGLSLTIGILVDDSIVIVEAIARNANLGLRGDAAALAGRRELGAAAFAITLVDVAVFAPVALMSGLVGEFMHEFGMVIVIATSFSLLVSFTLTPLLAARWALRPFESDRTPKVLPWTLRGGVVGAGIAIVRMSAGFFARIETTIARRYAHEWLPWFMRHRRLALACVASACVLSLVPVALGGIATEFSPPIERGEVTADLTFPAGTRLMAVDAEVTRLADSVLDDPEVTHVATTAGLSFNGIGNVFASNRAQIVAILRDPSSSPGAVLARMKRESDLVPGATIAGAGTGMGGRAPLSYNLAGDPVAVARGARRIASLLAASPSTTDVRTSDGGLGPRYEIVVNPGRAQLLGVSPDDVARTARLATGGAIATKVRLDSGLVDVVVRGPAARNGDLDLLTASSVRSADGRLVPLGAVAEITRRSEASVIEREDRERIATVSANMLDDAPIGPVASRVAAAMREPGFLPDGVRVASRGDIEQLVDAVSRIGAALALSIAVVYAILAVLYRSYVLPLVIMTTVPLATIGAFGTLYALTVLRTIFPAVGFLREQTLNVYSMLGILMLVGLVAKNGILLVEYAERNVREGAPSLSAICDAAERRFRPIVMTTVAMIAGMLPLALGETIGAEYRKALGAVVIGGLASSLCLTLFVVPLFYLAYRRNAMPPSTRTPPRPSSAALTAERL